MYRRSRGERIFNVFNHVLMVLISLIMLYPMLHVLFASVSNPNRLAGHVGPVLFPLGFSLVSYRTVLQSPTIIAGYKITLFVVFAGTALNVLLTVICGYCLSRKTLYIRKAVTLFIAFTMFFSGGMIPTYLVVKQLGLLNTIWALILPVAMSAFNMIIMRTYFSGIPDSLEESAKVDGANDLWILWRIYLPLAMPALAVISLYYAVSHWNSWFNAMIYITKREIFPVQLQMREILILNNTDNIAAGSQGLGEANIAATLKFATVIITTVPILLVYPFLQRYFVKGMTVGAVKG